MKKSVKIIIIAIVVLGAGASFWFFKIAESNEGHVTCALDAKLCPDGSYVTRVPPTCQFAACPQPADGILKGKVTVGPICPVEKAGEPCPVPAQAYTSREVIIYSDSSETHVVASKHFDEEGNYFFELPPGQYVVDIPKTGGLGTSTDLPKTVTINSARTATLNFSIDTGIR